MPSGFDIFPVAVYFSFCLVEEMRAAAEVFAGRPFDARSPIFLVADAAVKREFRVRHAGNRIGNDGRIGTKRSTRDRAQERIVVRLDRFRQRRIERPVQRARARGNDAQAQRDRYGRLFHGQWP